MAAPSLTSEQRQVLDRILSIGRRVGASPKEIKAAVETGLVESGLRNLDHGDADSKGWRQERASLYKDPTNLDASIRRFFQETSAVKSKHGRAGDLAAAVQRPAAQYRGRYQDRSGEAAALLRNLGAPGGGSTSRAPRATATQTVGGVDNSAARGALVASFLQGDTRFTRGTAADGMDTVDPVSFAMSMRKLKDVPGQTVPAATQPSSRASATGLVPVGGSKNAGHASFKVEGQAPDRLQKPLVGFAKKVAQVYGGTLTGKDGSTHSKYTVNGNVSDHHAGNATDIFWIDGKPARGDLLIRAGRAALIAAGMPRAQALKAPGGLYNVNGHQIIFGVDGAQNGGNHMDHLHISAR